MFPFASKAKAWQSSSTRSFGVSCGAPLAKGITSVSATAKDEARANLPAIFLCRLTRFLSGFLLYFANLFESLAKARLEPLVGWLIIPPSRQAFRQASHVGHFLFHVVRVLIALAVADVAHQPG